MEARPYFQFNREERNHAAILYHLLLSSPDNLKGFLALAGHTPTRGLEQCELYFEFAMLRDLWAAMDEKEIVSHLKPELEPERRTFVLSLLPQSVKDKVKDMAPARWNEHFRVVGNRSKKHYQSPARWSPSSMDGLSASEHEVLSKIKWCFNIKPDIVIITGDGEALCVEAKFDSGQSSYPSSLGEVARWKELGIDKRVTQLDCQRHLFKEILKFKHVKHAILQKDDAGEGSITWQKAFGEMDKEGMQPFVKNWLKSNDWL